MKYYLLRHILFFAGMTAAISSTSAQVVSPFIKAILNNGKLTLQMNSLSTTDSLFIRDSSNKVSLDFYFKANDSRNGLHSAQPNPQSQGSVYLSFQDIAWQTTDALTFSAAQFGPDGGIVRNYNFVNGDYSQPDGPPASACPSSITCNNTGLVLYFDPSQYSVQHARLTGIFFSFGAGDPHNGVYEITKIDKWTNSFFIAGNFDCNQISNGNILILYDDLVCQYAGGVLVGAPGCSPFGNYYTPGEVCAEYFENCGNNLVSILLDKIADLPCRQWKEAQVNDCGTNSYIYRPGKVSIGTSNQAPNSPAGGKSAVSVKNGVITDKVKIRLCDGSWCDYVFEPGYLLLSLPETENYIRQNCHLPGMPAGDEMEAAGAFELGEITRLQQEKIEEVFLHLIRLESEIDYAEALLGWLEWRDKYRTK